MNHVILRLTAAACLGHCLSPFVQAQLVQVGPGFVKAPFVRVYSNPDGSSYVRAPFVSVFSPGYYPRGFAYVPFEEPQLAGMDWRTLRQTIRRLSAELDGQLNAVATGDSWKRYLKTAEIRKLTSDDAGPPAADAFGALQEIRQAFDATKALPAFSAISRLASFQALDAALAEFLTLPEQRLRRQLSADDVELHRALDRTGAKESWHKYLALPPGIAASQGGDAPSAPTPSADELATVLKRFDLVVQNEKYLAIARLPAFAATRRHLSEYLAISNAPFGVQRPIEELPAPKPTN